MTCSRVILDNRYVGIWDESANGSSYSWGKCGITSSASLAVTYNSVCSVPKCAATALAYSASLYCASVNPEKWDVVVEMISKVIPRLDNIQAGRKIHKVAGVLQSEQPLELYRELISTWKNPGEIVLNATEPDTIVTHPPNWLRQDLDFPHQMMYLDSMSYLPDDILVKVDRAAMAVSLESRVPFLDRRVIEFAWQLPLSMKLRNKQGKWLLRQVLNKYVPSHLIDRPKMGFGVPIDSWLRNELRDWAESLLDEQRLEREGFFNVMAVREQWAEHLSGRFNRCYSLWNILMFQAWLEDHPQ